MEDAALRVTLHFFASRMQDSHNGEDIVQETFALSRLFLVNPERQERPRVAAIRKVNARHELGHSATSGVAVSILSAISRRRSASFCWRQAFASTFAA